MAIRSGLAAITAGLCLSMLPLTGPAHAAADCNKECYPKCTCTLPVPGIDDVVKPKGSLSTQPGGQATPNAKAGAKTGATVSPAPAVTPIPRQ